MLNTNTNIETPGARLVDAALRVLVATNRAELSAATADKLDAVCGAMELDARRIVDQFFDDITDAPWLAEMAFTAAALELADVGRKALMSFRY